MSTESIPQKHCIEAKEVLKASTSLEIKRGIAILVYGDDILILSKSSELVNDFLKQLGKSFKYTASCNWAIAM